jgi:inhibitor of cysteine peptidase
MFFSLPKYQYLALTVIIGLLLMTLSTVGYARAQSNAAEPNPIPQTLPVIGTKQQLISLLEAYTNDEAVMDWDMSTKRLMAAGNTLLQDQAGSEAAAAPYSTTNVQVEGVDEADIIKTDGTYVYQINGNQVYIIKAVPAQELEVTSRITFDHEGIFPAELFLWEDYLVVVGMTKTNRIMPMKKVLSDSTGYYVPSQNTCKVMVFNIGNKKNIQKVREIELSGSYISSRMIDSSFYLIASQNLSYPVRIEDPIVLPAYKDSVNGGIKEDLTLEQIHYFPECVYPAFVVIAGLDLDQPDEEADINCFLGNGEDIYASDKNLYIAADVNRIAAESVSQPNLIPSQKITNIFRFALTKGKTVYTGKGEVPGSILNQYSMDEYNGFFRVVTTTGDLWRNDEFTSKNNLYILDQDLAITGKIEGIAPTEKIYSARFMQNRAYLVTFRKVDPFFVIDLENPKEPKILGKLKIPGYSDYLHPYDENHIIGFGKETIEVKDGKGGSQAYYQGMKISIFDVTDVSNPLEMFKQVIGDRGTESELLNNPKALLFSREKGLLAFPVTVMEIQKPIADANPRLIQHGSFTFQGAYIYDIDLKEGLTLKGRITHITPEEYLQAGDRWYKDSRNIERIIFIGDNLLTLSQDRVMANKISNLEHIKTIDFR